MTQTISSLTAPVAPRPSRPADISRTIRSRACEILIRVLLWAAEGPKSRMILRSYPTNRASPTTTDTAMATSAEQSTDTTAFKQPDR